MVRYLDKENEMELLGDLFNIFYRNMESVALMEGCFEEEKAEWVTCIGAALRKPPRQILLLCAGNALAGFCMYYINGDLLMIEELQIQRAYQRTVLAAELFRFIGYNLLPQVRWMEAYAHSRNAASQRLMKKLGMEELGDDDRFLHFRMDVAKI